MVEGIDVLTLGFLVLLLARITTSNDGRVRFVRGYGSKNRTSMLYVRSLSLCLTCYVPGRLLECRR